MQADSDHYGNQHGRHELTMRRLAFTDTIKKQSQPNDRSLKAYSRKLYDLNFIKNFRLFMQLASISEGKD